MPVRSSGRLILSSRAQPMASSDFARQLLYSAGFEDIRAAQLTRLPEFSQTLPGGRCIIKPAVSLLSKPGAVVSVLLRAIDQHRTCYLRLSCVSSKACGSCR